MQADWLIRKQSNSGWRPKHLHKWSSQG